jgi:hypothetical protein
MKTHEVDFAAYIKLQAWYTKFPPKNTVADKLLMLLLQTLLLRLLLQAPAQRSSSGAAPKTWHDVLR